jgi:phage terminase small subunit
MTEDLTPKQQKFVEEYLIDLNATQAAIRAGYSEKTANEQASRLLANVKVSALIQTAMQKRSDRTEITQDMVLQRWWTIANADPNELIQYRRTSCRHCHGENHAYQWRDHEEFDHAVERATQKQGTRLPTDDGGYDSRLEPVESCPRCNGEGDGEVFAADTRKITGAARLLYDGVKLTEKGFEVKTRDRDKALENVARHLGMFTTKTELTGKDGGPIQTQVSGVLATLNADLQGKSVEELTRLFTEKLKG